MIFDFHQGKSAAKIKEITKSEIIRNSQYHFEPIIDIKYSKIQYKDNRFFYTRQEDRYLMFAYKKRYFTHKNGLPKYHVCQCPTKVEFSGFNYASAMPVEIYCRDQQKKLEELQYLKLCYNCITASQKGIYAFLAKDKPWYEYVLEYANSNNQIAKETKADGYVVLWKQISEAIRERAEFKCEICNIHLKDDKYYLEVHHKDYKKSNNSISNLQSLCVLCHANVDDIHLSNFKKVPLKVNAFIDDHKAEIKTNNNYNLLKWEQYRIT